ncbi:hypothetical protein ABEB36_012971 [Hypothenemus hampei]|uniref:Cytochrome P450 n=1 Tax=Hypothenemus hampei TaxID=57062 RepID=A0ABD1E6Q1_HYPHA
MISLLIFIIIGLFSFILWYKFVKPLNYFNKIGVKQTKPWPILGDQWRTVFKIMSFADFVTWIYNHYSRCRYIGFYQFTVPTLLVRDPELIKEITIKSFDHFTDHRSIIDPDIDPVWGNNIFLMKGYKWKEMRSALSRAFTSSKMKHMFEVINESAEKFAKYFIEKNDGPIELEMKNAYSRFSNDVIATTAFGIKVDSLREPNNEFYTLGFKMTKLTGIWMMIKFGLYHLTPKLCQYLKLSIFDQTLSSYFKNIILNAIKFREKNHIVRKDMIDILLKTKDTNGSEDVEVVETGFATVKEDPYLYNYPFKQLKFLTNEDIVSQAMIFFFAGFEGISSLLSYGSHELAFHKDIQDKLRDEIRQTHKLNNGKLTYEFLLSMKYMDMTFCEMVRKWAPALFVDRVCVKPYTIEPKYPDEPTVKLKPGDVLWIPIYALHRDQKYYPDPEQFNPERFSDENKDRINPYAYIPFGVGPRNCLGSRFAILECKALMYHLLLNFEIVPLPKTKVPLKFYSSSFANTVEKEVWLGLKRI